MNERCQLPEEEQGGQEDRRGCLITFSTRQVCPGHVTLCLNSHIFIRSTHIP